MFLQSVNQIIIEVVALGFFWKLESWAIDDALILPEMVRFVKSIEFSDVVDEVKNQSFFAQEANPIGNCQALCCEKRKRKNWVI